jgi:hypothetical protein
MQCLPGHAQWGGAVEALLGHPGPLWVCGESGSGVSSVAGWLAEQRGAALLDDAERLEPANLEAWVEDHPRGVLASHRSPETPALALAGSRCLAFRLPGLQDDPDCVPRCLAALAAEAGLPSLPPALGALPCPGNLRGLRNRVARWKLLGQLPDDPAAGPGLPLISEDLASNLHVLERLLLHRALRRSYGNRVEASRRLGVSRRQLYLLIARHGDPVRGEPPSSAGPKRLQKTRPANSRIPLADR